MRHLRVLLVDLLAFICLLLALTQLLSRSISPAQESEQVSSQVVAMQTPSSVESDQLPLMDFSDLKQRNPEVVGWIRIPETPIDFPVMQTTDNQFYLHHGLDGEYDRLGLPFLDYECCLEESDQLIVYGHNMGEGREERFSSLQHYRDPEYYSQHPVICFYTPHETMRYKVTAVLGLTARTEDADYFAFNELIDFPDSDARQRYMEQIAQRAFYMAGDFAHEEETLLTLCTCTYEMPDARLVVVARPMRENESEQADPVTVNPEPLLPLRWPRNE